MILNCVIIDNDLEALDLLKTYVEKVPIFNLIGTFSSFIDATADIRSGEIDVIFMCIKMSELNGLDFAKLLPARIRVVFTTAYKEYAFDGFKVNAVDYLLKPISFNDFLAACKKIKDSYGEMEKRDAVLEDNFFFVKTQYKMVKVNIDSILYVESQKEYVKFYLQDNKTIKTNFNLKGVEERLPKGYFKRTHRSFIVNMKNCESISSLGVMIGDKMIPISESFRPQIMQYVEEHML